MKDLEVASKKENIQDRIAGLGEFMSIASHGGMDAEQRQVFEKAQSILLGIPGHAKYYQDRIEAMRAEVLVNSRKSNEEISDMQDQHLEVVSAADYESYCINAFRTLAHIPSAECVAVLGLYLNDPVGRDGKTLLGDNRSNPGVDLHTRPINSEEAAKAIRKLGIEHPPFKPYDDRGLQYLREGEMDAWRDWWNEVKAGKRTYRFIGSNIEYGPDGPATKEQQERISMHQRMESEREARHGSNPDVKDDGSPAAAAPVSRKSAIYAMIAAALAVLAAIIWYFRRAKPAG